MVHDNAQCAHGRRADLGKVRELFMSGRHTAALSAMSEVDQGQLSAVEKVAFDAMLLVAAIKLHPGSYADRESDLAELIVRAAATQDPNIWAEVLGVQIMLSHRYNSDPSVTQKLVTDFFAKVPRQPPSVAHWAAVCGRIAFATLGPEIALGIFSQGVSSELAQGWPCLHESLWRYIAAMRARLNDLDGALAALEKGGVPEDHRNKYSRAQDGTVVSHEIALYRL